VLSFYFSMFLVVRALTVHFFKAMDFCRKETGRAARRENRSARVTDQLNKVK
jgi:hypothetical protein